MYTDTKTGKQFECTELHSAHKTCKDCENSRENLERTFRHASNYAYEASMGDYSMASINSSVHQRNVAYQAVINAGGQVNPDTFEVTWPEPQLVLPAIPSVGTDGLVRRYAVYNTDTEQFYTRGDGATLMPVESAKTLASNLNSAMKPEYQHYTVVTVIFNPEV